MIYREEKVRAEYVLNVAGAMMAAARTAPKGRGTDNLEICVAEGEELTALAATMRKIGTETGQEFFVRDAGNIELSSAVVLLGVKSRVRGLDCSWCGYETCALKVSEAPRVPCVFDVTDLGIAVGSAVSVAADKRVDNRIMYSAGVAAIELGLLPECKIVYAIPLSCGGKNIYFDRKSVSHK